jgi:hypothetical protein
MCSGPSRDNDIRQKIETALARRKEAFALGHLAWTADGYTVKFRQGIVDIVRTAVDDGVFQDDARPGLWLFVDHVEMRVSPSAPSTPR